MGRDKAGRSLDDPHFTLLRHGRETARQLPNDLVLPVAKFFSFDSGLAKRNAVFSHGGYVINDFGGMQKGFRWNTTDIQADPTQHR